MPKKIVLLIFSYGVLFFSSLFASNALEIPFLKIPDFSLPTVIENPTCKVPGQRFIWKRKLEFNGVNLEDHHHLMYSHIHEFRKRLSTLSDDEMIDMIKEIVLADSSIRDTFLRLNHNGPPISDCVKDTLDKNAFVNYEVRDIILIKINELKNDKNLCMASWSVFGEGQSLQNNDLLAINGKPMIFFGGSSNSLIRILEKDQRFASWSYVMFKENENNRNISLSLEDEKVKKLDLRNNLKGCFFQEQQDDLLREVQKLPTGSRKISNKMISPYTHSEQALRLFLLEHPEHIPGHLSPSDVLVLNIYTDRDPCVNCTKALSLETRMYNINPGTENIDDAYCFLQKRNYGDFLNANFDQKELTFPLSSDFYIFVSSSMTEKTRGLMGRLLGAIEKPIDPNIKLFFRYNGPFFSHEFTGH